MITLVFKFHELWNMRPLMRYTTVKNIQLLSSMKANNDSKPDYLYLWYKQNANGIRAQIFFQLPSLHALAHGSSVCIILSVIGGALGDFFRKLNDLQAGAEGAKGPNLSPIEGSLPLHSGAPPAAFGSPTTYLTSTLDKWMYILYLAVLFCVHLYLFCL